MQALALTEPAMRAVDAADLVTHEFAPLAAGCRWLRLADVGMVVPLPAAWRLERGRGALLGAPSIAYELGGPLARLRNVLGSSARDGLQHLPPFGLNITVYLGALHSPSWAAYRPSMSEAGGESALDEQVAAAMGLPGGASPRADAQAPPRPASVATVSQLLLQLHMLRHGPAQRQGEESAAPTHVPQILSTWGTTVARADSGMVGADGAAFAGDAPPLHVHGVEYALDGVCYAVGEGGDAAASHEPAEERLLRLHHHVTFIADEVDGSVREVTFTAPDAWWETLWPGGDAGAGNAKESALRAVVALPRPLGISAIVDSVVCETTVRGAGDAARESLR